MHVKSYIAKLKSQRVLKNKTTLMHELTDTYILKTSIPFPSHHLLYSYKEILQFRLAFLASITIKFFFLFSSHSHTLEIEIKLKKKPLL